MELYEAIRLRYSCRQYFDKPVEQEKLDRIFDAARLAPSAKNFQDWRFVLVTEKNTKLKLAQAARNQMFIAQAGAIVVACGISDYVMRCGQPCGAIDVAIALEHIALAATAEGLASCWIGSFDPDEVRKILDIPKDVAVIELMPLGYPADARRTPSRLKIDKIVCMNKWQFVDYKEFSA